MKATETLKHEHVVIGRALKIQAAMAAGAAAGHVPPEPDLQGLLEVFTGFADGCHHVKEETILFPALETAGLPHDRGPLAAMLDQHERGRSLVAELRAAEPALARDAAARTRFVSAARDYVALLEQHITIENEVLFPGADRLLPAERDAEISAAFDRHEEIEMGAGVHQRFHRVLDELGTRYQ